MQFGLKQVIVSTMQALSGAGYPGVPSLDIIDNVVPFISRGRREDGSEAQDFGYFNGKIVQNADFKLSASCNRVNVKDGHLESVFVKLDEDPDWKKLPLPLLSSRANHRNSSCPLLQKTQLWFA